MSAKAASPKLGKSSVGAAGSTGGEPAARLYAELYAKMPWGEADEQSMARLFSEGELDAVMDANRLSCALPIARSTSSRHDGLHPYFHGRTEKKAKLSMQDAESFVDHMKWRFARSPEQYDRFIEILQVRRAPPMQWRAANLTNASAGISSAVAHLGEHEKEHG